MRTPEVLVPFIGLLYSGLYLLYTVVLSLMAGGVADFVYILGPFVAIFLLAAFGVWRRFRFAFLGAAILSALFLFLEGPFVVDSFGNPANYELFFGTITIIFSLLASLVYSVLGFRMFWNKSGVAKPRKTMHFSSSLAWVFLGVIIGALFVGALAGATETRLLNNGQADISIVAGAASPGSQNWYAPASFTAHSGDTVTWANRDGAAHTVTSDTGTVLDSGNMNPGESFSHMFTSPGTFAYHCEYHAWMKGTVVVVP